MPSRRLRAAAARGAVVASLAATLAACAPDFHGVVLDPPDPAPPLALVDSTGATFDLAAQRGKVVLVFFGYTHCPDVCPTTLADWHRARLALGDDAAKVRWVFVSVDPERDDPRAAHRYAAKFDPTFTGLSGTPPQVAATLAQWRIGAHRDDAGRDTAAAYTVSHPSTVFVVDREGRTRLLHRLGLPADQVAADVRSLL